ncbi:hypothetical protein HK101_006263, partial [Irineochytrium annulatum]
ELVEKLSAPNKSALVMVPEGEVVSDPVAVDENDEKGDKDDDDEPDFLKHFSGTRSRSNSAASWMSNPKSPVVINPVSPPTPPPQPASAVQAAIRARPLFDAPSVHGLLGAVRDLAKAAKVDESARLCSTLLSTLATAVDWDQSLRGAWTVTSTSEDGIKLSGKIAIENPTDAPLDITNPLILTLSIPTSATSSTEIHQLAILRLDPVLLPPHASTSATATLTYAPATRRAALEGGRWIGARVLGGCGDDASLITLNVGVDPTSLPSQLSDLAPAVKLARAAVQIPWPGPGAVSPASSVADASGNVVPAAAAASGGPLLTRCGFRMLGGGFGVGTGRWGRSSCWCDFRRPSTSSTCAIEVRRVVGDVRGDQGRVIGRLDWGGKFVIPAAAGEGDDGVVTSPLFEVESEVDCRGFGTFIRAVRRRLEVEVDCKVEVMVGSYGPIILEYKQAGVPCVLGGP